MKKLVLERIYFTQATVDRSIDDSSDSNISGRSSSSGSVSSGSGSSSGLLSRVGNTVGGVVNATPQTVGGVTATTGQTPGGAARTLGRIVNGIQISGSTDASASATTTLSARNGSNLRLEKSARFQIRLGESVRN